MFPRLPARATFVADTKFVSETHKMFLILFRNILCLQQMLPILRSPRNIMSNNVSATMCPRLPVPLKNGKTTHAYFIEDIPCCSTSTLLKAIVFTHSWTWRGRFNSGFRAWTSSLGTYFSIQTGEKGENIKVGYNV